MDINQQFLNMIDAIKYNPDFRNIKMMRSHCYRVKLANMRGKNGWDVLHAITKVSGLNYKFILDTY